MRQGNMGLLLKLMFGFILLTMLGITSKASMQEALWKIPEPVTGDPWFQATLFDAYFGFLTFYTWVFYKERTVVGKVFWFAAIMLGGNIAMSSYMLLQLSKLKRGDSFERLLTK